MMNYIVVGSGMVFLTTIIHALFTVAGVKMLRRFHSNGQAKTDLAKAILVSLLTVWVFIGVVLDVWLWALLYLYDPAITPLSDLGTALYFSMATFTTVGYGDVVLAGKGRILAAMEAVDGMIIFGWSAAMVFGFIQRIFYSEE